MKRKLLLLGLCAVIASLAVVSARIIYKQKTHSTNFKSGKSISQSGNSTNVIAGKRNPADDLAVLNYVKSKYDVPSDWKVTGKSLTATETAQIEYNGQTIPMHTTLSIANSGFGPGATTYAALIEKDERVNESDDPDGFAGRDYNGYECDLLILKRNKNRWFVDYFGQVDKKENFSNATGMDQSCGDGYRLIWENGRPNFVGRKITTGPYNGGYSKAVMSIGWVNGTYKLDGVIVYEGYFSDDKLVANYYTGKYGDEGYEHLSFRVTEYDKRDKIIYSYGKNNRHIKLSYAGVDMLHGEPCFKVMFPNKNVLYIIPKGRVLKVSDSSGKYLKTFQWEDDNVSRHKTTSAMNLMDEEQSMALVSGWFLNGEQKRDKGTNLNP